MRKLLYKAYDVLNNKEFIGDMHQVIDFCGLEHTPKFETDIYIRARKKQLLYKRYRFKIIGVQKYIYQAYDKDGNLIVEGDKYQVGDKLCYHPGSIHTLAQRQTPNRYGETVKLKEIIYVPYEE